MTPDPTPTESTYGRWLTSPLLRLEHTLEQKNVPMLGWFWEGPLGSGNAKPPRTIPFGTKICSKPGVWNKLGARVGTISCSKPGSFEGAPVGPGNAKPQLWNKSLFQPGPLEQFCNPAPPATGAQGCCVRRAGSSPPHTPPPLPPRTLRGIHGSAPNGLPCLSIPHFMKSWLTYDIRKPTLL